MLLLSASGVAAAAVILAVLVWLYLHREKVKKTRGAAREAPLTGRALPPPKPVKGVAPWNILSLYQPQNMDFGSDALTVRYVAGNVGSKSGGGFHANPFGLLPADACAFEYSVYFPPNFDFNKGGKLPGLCFGTDNDDCATGGDWSAGGGSFRTVFRDDGLCVANLYLALGSSEAALEAQSAEYKRLVDKTSGGHLVWYTSNKLKFKRGVWNAVRMRLVLNTPGERDGMIELTLNGVTRTLNGIMLRRSDTVKVRSVSMHTFFGGSGQEWAAPPNMSVKFRNAAFS